MNVNTDICELFGSEVVIRQYLDGYRFSIDSVLLAWWCRIPKESGVVDMGTGCGVISMILAAARGFNRITALEIQDELYEICRHNVERNRLDDVIEVVKADLRELDIRFRSEYDVAVANPPFREIGSGRLSATGQKATARHELELTLDKLLSAARFLLKDGGTFNVIYPIRRRDEIMSKMPVYELYPSRIREVLPRRDEPANLILIESTTGKIAETVIEEPLVIYEGEEYSDEVAAMYEPVKV
ncbi:MAG: methyltransferase [bacterium]|nr:methyltransferase [bacterium]